jgi:hypothetical protein
MKDQVSILGWTLLVIGSYLGILVLITQNVHPEYIFIWNLPVWVIEVGCGIIQLMIARNCLKNA